MKVQVYYNTWTCSMFPDLVGELTGARQPEALPWAYIFVAAWQGSLIWEVLEGKGLGVELHLLAAPSPQKPRPKHESDLHLIPPKLIIFPLSICFSCKHLQAQKKSPAA